MNTSNDQSCKNHPCWLCDSTSTRLIRQGNTRGRIETADFRITDANYGVTADLYQCSQCAFLFCPTVEDVTAHYEKMDDAQYEATRSERSLQAQKILQQIRKFKPTGALLDVGAGSGILVEQARSLSFDAVGIEPSAALSATAQALQLPVICGTLPQESLRNRFDVVTLIDVIEHVDDPRAMMRNIVDCMKQDAVCVVITPDVNSLAARVMQSRWWHFRLAHIGYFNPGTLQRLMATAGLEVIALQRPGWYFPASYLLERVMQYVPARLRIKAPAWLDRITIPLNLFDSLLLVCKKR